jgi:hypothetical protein
MEQRRGGARVVGWGGGGIWPKLGEESWLLKIYGGSCFQYTVVVGFGYGII